MLIRMVDKGTASGDLKPSQELLETIAMAKGHVTKAVEYVKKAYDLAIRDGFHPLQARDFLMVEMPFLAESTIRKALPPEAKDSRKVRTFAIRESQHTEPKAPNIVNITTKAEIKDAELVINTEVEDPKDLEIQFLKEKVIELEEALKKTQLFVPATQLPTINEAEAAVAMTDEAVYKYLRDRATQTGDVIVIDRVGSGALVQALAQYKNSFGVAELFLRVIK